MRRCVLLSILLLSIGVRAETEYRVYLPMVERNVIPAQGVGATYVRDAGDCEQLQATNATWFYNWRVDPPTCTGVYAVPMIWDEQYIDRPIADGGWLMGPNECSLPTQCNQTPCQMAAGWHRIEENHPDRKLVSPSDDLSWLTAWWNCYIDLYGHPPRVDAVGHHCYGAYDLEFALIKCKMWADLFVEWAQARGIGEVWVTEFAHLPCWEADGEQASLAFMGAMVEHYKADPTITRWAWFQSSYHGTEPWAFGPLCNTSLVDMDTGELTPMGTAYRRLGQEW